MRLDSFFYLYIPVIERRRRKNVIVMLFHIHENTQGGPKSEATLLIAHVLKTPKYISMLFATLFLLVKLAS